MGELVAGSNRVRQTDPEFRADLSQLLAGRRRLERTPVVGSLELGFEAATRCSSAARAAADAASLVASRVVALGGFGYTGGQLDRKLLPPFGAPPRHRQFRFECLPSCELLADPCLKASLLFAKALRFRLKPSFRFGCGCHRVANLTLQALLTVGLRHTA